MAGRMGNESVTVKNLKVLQVDEKNGIVVVNGWVQDALGKPWPKGPMRVEELVPVEVLEGATAEASVGVATAAA
jgi:large subunit ribosomal protein L3